MSMNSHFKRNNHFLDYKIEFGRHFKIAECTQVDQHWLTWNMLNKILIAQGWPISCKFMHAYYGNSMVQN